MKIAFVLCTLFALTLAFRPVPVNVREHLAKRAGRESIRYPGGILKRDSNRIVGGYNDAKHAHKYQVSLQKLPSGGEWYHTCGGSIIKKNRILTAAHCIDSGTASDYRIVAGEHELYYDEGNEETIGAASLSIHPKWDEANINNDVGVVRLPKDISISTRYADIVTLATKVPDNEKPSTVTGWGYTNYAAQTRPTILQVLKTENFRKKYWWSKGPGSYSSIWDESTQVATINTNKGICMGDSGGPLVVDETGEQYGVCSYVLTPCGENRPDYYASVKHFRSWILSQ